MMNFSTFKNISNLGGEFKLFLQLFANFYTLRQNYRQFVNDVFFTGALSIIIITISGFFVGLVLGLQGYETLKRFGSTEAVGTMVALSLIRELGPVITAILFSARAGSAITAKIGLMKSSDQLIAMEMMSVLPLKKIYVPIFYAGAISVPLLTGIFCSVGVLGGYFITVVILGVDAGAFWSQMQNSVDLHHDILNGAIKSVCFALVINLIAIYEGIISKPTADGVSRAVTNTVVISALSVLAVDFILTSFMFTGA